MNSWIWSGRVMVGVAQGNGRRRGKAGIRQQRSQYGFHDFLPVVVLSSSIKAFGPMCNIRKQFAEQRILLRGTGWGKGPPVRIGDDARRSPQARFLACGMRRKGLWPVSLDTDFRVHRQTASCLNVVSRERDFQEQVKVSMDEQQGGPGGISGGGCLPASRSESFPLPQQKKPKDADLQAWALDAWSLALLQLIKQRV